MTTFGISTAALGLTRDIGGLSGDFDPMFAVDTEGESPTFIFRDDNNDDDADTDAPAEPSLPFVASADLGLYGSFDPMEGFEVPPADADFTLA